MKKQWRVGWKPIDKATATPQWSGIIFDCFSDASHAADALNKTDPTSHYFPDIIPEAQPEQCTDCGRVFEKDVMKPPPDPAETGRLCPSCWKHADDVLRLNGSFVGLV